MEFSVPLSSLALLVPPLRLMSAVMWEVVRQRNIKHYGKLEEFVSMVTDAVPELMSKREGRLLSLGLRARTTLELLRSEHPEDLKAVETHLNRIRSCIEETNDPVIEAPEANFMKLVQGLIEDTDGREHFLKNVFPVEYGPDFDTALETLVCEFFTRLEELLPIPDFKQTASWISAAPSVLEEYMQCVSNGDDLKFLLQSKQCHGKLAKSSVAPFHSDDLLIPSLCLPPSLEVAIASHPSACDENNDVPQIVMFDEELSTNPSTSTDFPESPKRTDISSSPRRRQQSGVHKCPECDKCSSITLSSSNTRESTVGCCLTTALSVGGLSEQPLCWPVTGYGNAKMLHICALNVGTVFQPHWTNLDTTAQNGAVTMIVGTVERVFKSPVA